LASPTSVRGQQGERQAADFLTRQGFRILQHNYRCRLGEIDIVAREGEILCFVEVRSLRRTAHGDPLETVGSRKQQRLIRAAQHYLMTHRYQGPVRFDVIGIVYEPTFSLRHVRNAFEAHSAW